MPEAFEVLATKDSKGYEQGASLLNWPRSQARCVNTGCLQPLVFIRTDGLICCGAILPVLALPIPLVPRSGHGERVYMGDLGDTCRAMCEVKNAADSLVRN